MVSEIRSFREKKAQSFILFLVSALVLLSACGSVGAMGTTHNVYGKLLNADGGIPSEGDVQFTAYINTRPKEKIVHPGSAGSGYKEGWWVVNAGNFPSSWKTGEVLVVEFVNLSTGEWTVVEQAIEAHQAKEIIVRLKGGLPPKYHPRYR